MPANRSPQDVSPARGVVFQSAIGWMALNVADNLVTRLQIGLGTRNAALKALRGVPVQESAAEQRLIERLQRFADGQKTSLSTVPIDISGMTEFQRAVTEACRAIGWGETLTYGQLAEVSGYPGASRAVGTVMARNRFPLIVPCHRVTASTGLGGYSAPDGVCLKEKLLENEASPVACR